MEDIKQTNDYDCCPKCGNEMDTLWEIENGICAICNYSIISNEFVEDGDLAQMNLSAV